MKKILYILFCLVPLLAMQSCTEDLAENELTLDGKISTTISVTVPQLPDAHPQTRAMAVNPQMENLYLAVFDANGYLLEYVQADATSQMATTNGTDPTYNYKVSLKPTTGTTYVHFIGNSPVASLDFGHERELMKNLYTENGNEAYWQRVKVEGGINASTTALTGVKLIRNFAWINVVSGVDNFTLHSYCVVNTRTAGSVAPYNTNNNQFVTFSDNKTYATITGSGEGKDGYNGFIPSNAQINNAIPAEDDWFLASSESSVNNYAYFVYEREKALSNPPFILMKGYYNGNTEKFRYYKVDLRDSQGNYFPIVRNFKYRINITGVGHSGYDSAEAAANGAGSGDVSSAIETQSFNNISNGDERLFVSYTDTTLVEKSDNVKLRYKYIVYNTDTSGKVTEDNKTSTATVTTTGTVIRESYNVTHGSGEWNGWYEITFSTTDIASANKTQTFIITGTYNERKLQRTVNITLRNKYTMAIECNPDEIPTDMGKPFDVIVNVPGGLGRSMFPLEFHLEAANQSMTPNLGDNLPTVTGPSIVPEKNKTTIGYIKQVSWADYEAFFEANTGTSDMPVTCHFKSNKSNAAGTTTTIYASNKYFNQASDNLGYFDAEQFTNLQFSNSNRNENLPGSINQPITFTFNMSALPSSVTGSDGKVTVALYNLKPAEDDANGLTQTGSDAAKGIAYYTFTPTSTSANLKLQNTDVNVEAKVVLSSYHFESAEKAMNYTKGTFTNLSLTSSDKYLAKDSGVNFKFRLSRQVKQGRYVTVTLGNLVPADNETRLTVIDEKAGTYRFDPTGVDANIDITLQLKVKNSFQTVSAKLSADYFEDSSTTTLNPERGTFTNLNLTATDTKLTANSTVTFKFNVPSELPGGYITISLDNLKTTEGETSFKYYPEASELGKQKTLTFTVEESYNPVKVTLSADCFASESESLNPVIQIPAGNIQVNSSLSGNEFSIYATNPGTNTNVTAIHSFTPNNRNNYSNSDSIDVGEYYQTIMNRDEDKGFVFIRYRILIYNGYWPTYTYYVAKVSLEKLMTTVVTLESINFEEQK